MSLKLDGKKLSLEIEERLNDYISSNKKIMRLSILEILIGCFNGTWLLLHR